MAEHIAGIRRATTNAHGQGGYQGECSCSWRSASITDKATAQQTAAYHARVEREKEEAKRGHSR